jgi:hypothetical protein
MKRTIAILLILLSASTAAAQETPAQWAAKLGSRTYAEREKAAQVLEQMGSAAMPALRHAAATADLETKRRAVLIMERIEDRLLIDELTAATPLRLQFKDVLVEDALREVESRTGLSLGSVGGMKRIAQCDTGELPHWQAWRKFCDAAGIQEADTTRAAAKLRRLRDEDLRAVARTLDSMELGLRSRFAPLLNFAKAPSADPFSYDDGRSIRVRVKWHSLDNTIDEKKPHAVFAVEVRTEPRLEILKPLRVEVTKLVDAMGVSRAVEPAKLYEEPGRTEDALFLAAYSGEVQYGGLLHLKPVAWKGPPMTLKELHGKVRFEVTARPRLMELTNVAKSVGKEIKSFQGVTLKVLEFDRDDEGEIQLKVNLNNLASLAPMTPEEQIVRVRPGVIAVRGEIDVALERLELLNSAGRKCQLLRARYEQAGKGKGYDAELTFATSSDKTNALTLVMTKGPRSIAVELPFLVRDVVWGEKNSEK